MPNTQQKCFLSDTDASRRLQPTVVPAVTIVQRWRYPEELSGKTEQHDICRTLLQSSNAKNAQPDALLQNMTWSTMPQLQSRFEDSLLFKMHPFCATKRRWRCRKKQRGKEHLHECLQNCKWLVKHALKFNWMDKLTAMTVWKQEREASSNLTRNVMIFWSPNSAEKCVCVRKELM